MDNRTQEFLNNPIMPLLIRMSAPNTIAFFIQAIVVLTEVWFISKLGTNSLAAVALAFPLLMLMILQITGDINMETNYAKL